MGLALLVEPLLWPLRVYAAGPRGTAPALHRRGWQGGGLVGGRGEGSREGLAAHHAAHRELQPSGLAGGEGEVHPLLRQLALVPCHAMPCLSCL